MAISRGYAVSSRFLLLDGAPVGPLHSAAGGDARGEVVRASLTGGVTKKQLAGVRYSDLELRLGLDTLSPLSDWISASWAGSPRPRNGTLLTADVNHTVREEREFLEAALLEVGFPALDASAKEAGLFDLRLRPAYTRDLKGGRRLPAPLGKVRPWTPSFFRLEIAGLDCRGVNRIDPFVVKQTPTGDEVGGIREPQPPPAPEFPDLRVTVSAHSIDAWTEWHRRFVIEGRCSDADERTGAIVLLSPDLRTERGRIELFGVGIYGWAAEGGPAGADMRRFVAELYCERMELTLGAKPETSAKVATPPSPA
jgi:hypothetical protein